MKAMPDSVTDSDVVARHPILIGPREQNHMGHRTWASRLAQASDRVSLARPLVCYGEQFTMTSLTGWIIMGDVMHNQKELGQPSRGRGGSQFPIPPMRCPRSLALDCNGRDTPSRSSFSKCKQSSSRRACK